MQVSVLDIYIGKRVREDMGDIRDMAMDLMANGQITAITVRRPSDEDRAQADYIGQPYVLVGGGRRLAAALSIGWKNIEAYVREDSMDETQHRILELHENIKRKQMTMEEEVKATAEIYRLRQMQNPEIRQDEVAVELGMSRGHLSKSVAAAAAIEKNPDLAKAGSIEGVIRADRLERELKAKLLRSGEEAAQVRSLNLEERIVTADMRDWLRTRADASADLALVDYPYGMNFWSLGQKTKSDRKGLSFFDDTPEYAHDLVTDTLPQVVRVTRPDGWMVFFANYDFEKFLRAMLSDICTVHYEYRLNSDEKHCLACMDEGTEGTCTFLVPAPIPWIWFRPNSQNNPRDGSLHAKNHFEYMVIVNRGAGRLNLPNGKANVPNVLVHDAYYGADRIHANQKPIELYQDLIERLSYPGAIVIDPAYGSGSSMAAAVSLGRYPYGSEINPVMRGPAIGLAAKHMVAMTAEGERAALTRDVSQVEVLDEDVLGDTTEVEDTQQIQMKAFFARRDELAAEDKAARQEHKDAKEAAARWAAAEKAAEEEDIWGEFEPESEDESFELVD